MRRCIGFSCNVDFLKISEEEADYVDGTLEETAKKYDISVIVESLCEGRAAMFWQETITVPARCQM